jgi:hypothetical protein
MKPAWRKRPGSAGRNDTRLPVDLINMSTAKAAVTEVIEPLVRGMEAVRPAVWVTSLSDEHRALLCIQPYKGAVFELEYGISCSWIPHLEGNRWRWHRTVRQSRRDLWVSHFTVDAPSRPISHLYGVDHLRRQAEEALEAVAPLARHWWDTVTAIPGVITEARRQENAGGALSIHWPRPGLVTAFTLCRLGDLPAAKRHLVTAGGLSETQLPGALDRLAEMATLTS